MTSLDPRRPDLDADATAELEKVDISPTKDIQLSNPLVSPDYGSDPGTPTHSEDKPIVAKIVELDEEAAEQQLRALLSKSRMTLSEFINLLKEYRDPFHDFIGVLKDEQLLKDKKIASELSQPGDMTIPNSEERPHPLSVADSDTLVTIVAISVAERTEIEALNDATTALSSEVSSYGDIKTNEKKKSKAYHPHLSTNAKLVQLMDAFIVKYENVLERISSRIGVFYKARYRQLSTGSGKPAGFVLFKIFELLGITPKLTPNTHYWRGKKLSGAEDESKRIAGVAKRDQEVAHLTGFFFRSTWADTGKAVFKFGTPNKSEFAFKLNSD